jgi:hypothetical protein
MFEAREGGRARVQHLRPRPLAARPPGSGGLGDSVGETPQKSPRPSLAVRKPGQEDSHNRAIGGALPHFAVQRDENQRPDRSSEKRAQHSTPQGVLHSMVIAALRGERYARRPRFLVPRTSVLPKRGVGGRRHRSMTVPHRPRTRTARAIAGPSRAALAGGANMRFGSRSRRYGHCRWTSDGATGSLCNSFRGFSERPWSPCRFTSSSTRPCLRPPCTGSSSRHALHRRDCFGGGSVRVAGVERRRCPSRRRAGPGRRLLSGTGGVPRVSRRRR